MDPEPVRDWRRWATSEQNGGDDEADAAFRALFAAVPVREPAPGFSGRVSQAVARATSRAALRRARFVKAGIAAGGVLALILAIALVRQIPRLLTAALDLIVGAVVSMTVALGHGLDVWTLLAQLARAIGLIVVTPQASYALIGLGLMALGALYGLRRMLELEERSSS
jgi:hypothetical protein